MTISPSMIAVSVTTAAITMAVFPVAQAASHFVVAWAFWPIITTTVSGFFNNVLYKKAGCNFILSVLIPILYSH